MQISSPVHVRLDSFNVASHKNHEEVDVNSAVRKAIENAQESIRIAMESVGRKKIIGLKSFSNNRFNGEGNMEDDVTAATSSKVFTGFLDAKKLYAAKMIMDEINEKIAELTKECSIPVTGETETIKTETANFVIEDQTCTMFVDDYEAKLEVEDQNDHEINAFKIMKQDVEYAENIVELESDKGINKVFESCETKVNLHVDRQEDNGKAADDVDVNVNIVETTQDVDQDEYQKNIKDSQESQYRGNEDETEEPRPSKMSGQDHFRRIYEEAAAKERERVKNKLVIERAVSEARDRASAEERERAERQWAAVKEAIEEARRRKMAVARETVAKSKHKVERAAVERAPSDARQRAIEKAMSQKTVSDINSSGSALRTKAKLDKHNRIMERAAKVLAEKEKRDRLAQKEQAERNRLAENLDAEIKRWSNGKEGNLRALLSTLQYILGPDSGWQPVSLAHIMTTSDVKKAYRKATLCVHPDKLHQWGATIQHKYICEKVFDLLKTAWKRFNSEER